VEIKETPTFTKQVTALLSDDEYRLLQSALITNPEMGDVIPECGGIRKARWGAQGRGKRGGVRVIYYWMISRDCIYMLLVYSKPRKDDLTPDQKKKPEEGC
jgi:mRNA-degrading endonuclease RelE of RelBE toxin-antitoxin system